MNIFYSSQKYIMVSHDITNHCNARCRFCFNDWDHLKSCNMPKDMFRHSREIIPLTIDGGFLLSCLFEPTLNPEFMDILEMVPEQYKRHVYFTTNLARRLTDAELETMCRAHVCYFNISLETYQPDKYTFLSGVKNVQFYDNLTRLAEIARRTGANKKIRILTMILRSNQDELEELIQRVHDEINPVSHELRTPYISDPIEGFLNHELLSRNELQSLQEKIQNLGYSHVALDMGRDHETLERHLAQKKMRSTNGVQKDAHLTEAYRVRIGPNGLPIWGDTKEPHWKDFSYDFLYRARINSDGTGYFEDNDIYFDLNQIDDPLLFFSENLIKMEQQDVSRYLVETEEPLDLKERSDESILGCLDKMIVMDSEFLTFSGWFFSQHPGLAQGERMVLLTSNTTSHSLLLRTKATLRQDVAKSYSDRRRMACGFMCRIEKSKLNLGTSYHLLAGYRLGNKFYAKRLCLLPPLGQFVL